MSEQRERFEAWAKREGFNLTKHDHGGYYFAETSCAWRGFQAACPEGWLAVPKIATKEMREAGMSPKAVRGGHGHFQANTYIAMLSAAPKPGEL